MSRDIGAVDERAAFEEWAASVGYHTERDMFQREKYQSTLTWELWRVWQARAALSAPNHSEQVREGYHTLPEIDLILLAEQFVISTGRIYISALQRNFRIDYHKACRVMEALEIRDVVSAIDEFGQRTLLTAAAPSAGSQEQG